MTDKTNASSPQEAAPGAVGVREFQDMEFMKEDGQVGDCVRASTATILGLDRSEVPHFVRDHSGHWRHAWEDWLEARGLEVVEIDPRQRPDCEYLACGPTVRSVGDGTASHMVVMQWTGLLHDPHPSRSGLIGIDRVYLLVPKLALLPSGQSETGGEVALPIQMQERYYGSEIQAMLDELNAARFHASGERNAVVEAAARAGGDTLLPKHPILAQQVRNAIRTLKETPNA